ncbi:hypothetical protein CEK28_10375 [Xenophilus sp. AP218F]|nr:hypothetical protein [Chromobacterium sp. ASV5]OWY38925.1 hypothetical protein CEK28_10375 [Xenophilus sp. AP218F]
MSIKVTNNSNETYQVAINQWGTGGDTSYFTLTPGKSDSWDRTDFRGFVLSLQARGKSTAYIVFPEDDISINESNVTANGKALNHAVAAA